MGVERYKELLAAGPVLTKADFSRLKVIRLVPRPMVLAVLVALNGLR